MTNEIKGWRTRSSNTVYDNPWIRLTHNEVITPAGTDGIYGVVHFKNTAIGVLPLDQDNYTWLVKQSRYSLGVSTWEIPEGGCPTGEEPLAAARRELEEETGWQARQWQELLTLHLSNSVTDEKAIVFIARDLYAGEQALEPTEDIEVKRLPFSEALAMVLSGEITDAISVAAILRAALDPDINPAGRV
ncbi:NUDIX domain-containing protein [Cellvibrio polysaccharolyticus]|uniref:GDP-mannose pyrophosphatase n=1 Tax=Cellvibrio polysaccharolyticus TaxID=2082724 RepID=A0A928UZX1_9GAMM|nr:NUDIX hydrolase [Cellvibrio polysaccharolyticus]MBE8716153.1 NUDIX hydrolase [Cellvibrio polysaccharolyticus]